MKLDRLNKDLMDKSCKTDCSLYYEVEQKKLENEVDISKYNYDHIILESEKLLLENKDKIFTFQ